MRFLDDLPRYAFFTGRGGVGKTSVACATAVQGAVDALADANRTRMVLVTRAQHSALAEVARTHEELTATGIGRHHVVVNGPFPSTAVGDDALAASIVRREQAAMQAMPSVLQTLPRDEVALKPFNLVGVQTSRRLFTGDTPGLPVPSSSVPSIGAASLGDRGVPGLLAHPPRGTPVLRRDGHGADRAHAAAARRHRRLSP